MKKILLVEDTTHLAEEIADILRLEQYFVELAGNGLVALGMLKTFRPDLIISDLLMPGMDGFELIRRIRALPDFEHIPIVILSAKTSVADKNEGKNAGASAFVSKPCKAHDLISTVKGLLE